MRKCDQLVGFPAVPCMNKATGYTKGDPMKFLCDYHRDIHEKYHNSTTLDLPKREDTEESTGG